MDGHVTRHDAGSRFTIDVDGHQGLLDYVLGSDRRLVITHTEVPPALRGRGVAGQLVRAAFDYAKAEGLTVVPRCSYAAEWIERHPEYAELVAGS